MLKRAPFKPRLKLLHKGLLLVLAPLAIELLFILTLWHLLDTADHQTRRLAHSRNVTAELNKLQELIVEQAKATLFLTVTDNDENKQRYLTDTQTAIAQFDLLDLLCADSLPEHQACEQLKQGLQGMILTTERPLRLKDKLLVRQDITAWSFHSMLKECVPIFKDACAKLLAIETRTQAQDQLSENSHRRALRVWIGACLGAHILLTAFIALYFYKNLLARLHVLLQNANRLASGKPLLPKLKGGDEIDQFDAAFHHMANELAAAAEYKKQMIAIVSHELRTPLTSIYGSLTLLTSGALGALGKAQEALSFQLEETSGKLIELINELLDKEKARHGQIK